MSERKAPALGRPGALLAAAVGVFVGGWACRSASHHPQAAAPAPPPDLLRALEGQTLVLRHQGDASTIALKRAELAALSGECDVVVEVQAATFENGAAHFRLEVVGRPRLAHYGARQERCRRDQSHPSLSVSGFESEPSAADLAAVGQVLSTPEAYMKVHGLTFDLPAAPPSSIPAPSDHASVRPERMIWADAVRHDPARRVHYEGTVELEGVVGTDGRLYDVKVLTPLSAADEESVRRVLPLWRFQPGRRGQEVVPVRVREQLVFRIYF